MNVERSTAKPLFCVDELRQEHIIEAIDAIISRIRHLKINPDAVYPADPASLPFSMYISRKLSIPIKTEKFLRKTDKILVIFSGTGENLNPVTPKFVAKKLNILRKNYPLSPSILIYADREQNLTDIQLIIYRKKSRIHTYKFLSEAVKNFYFPVEGDFTHYSKQMWEEATREMENFERAKRIKDNSMKYSVEEHIPLKINEPDIDLVLWEKLSRFELYTPEEVNSVCKDDVKVKYEKLIKINNNEYSPPITFILEVVSYHLEETFPVRLAYTNYEIEKIGGILIVPSAKETMGGVDLKLEITLITKEQKQLKEDTKNLLLSLKKVFKTIVKDILDGKAFRPHMDYIIEQEEAKATVYIDWYLDREMLLKINEHINKKWLFARLYQRKKFTITKRELIKHLESFEFKPGSPALELLKFLLHLKGYESHHEFFAMENRYFCPVITRRIYRPNWERAIKENLDTRLTREPLNPESPVTYILTDEKGNFLGTIPEIIAHYISAKEEAGMRIQHRKLYFDPVIFSEKSFWIEIECLSE